MRAKQALVSVHKWIGLVVGIQIALWMLSGLVMAVLPIEIVRGEDHIAKPAPALLADMNGLIGVDDAISGRDAVAAALTTLAGMPVYELRGASGAMTLIDARTGAVISPLNETLATQIAAADFSGSGKPVSAVMISEAGGDYRGRLPAWRIQFDDADATRIYVAANDGRVSARRNDTWRLYDFFWMLHIMDYSERENFNSPWLVVLAAGGLAVALSGVSLIWFGLIQPLLKRGRQVAA